MHLHQEGVNYYISKLNLLIELTNKQKSMDSMDYWITPSGVHFDLKKTGLGHNQAEGISQWASFWGLMRYNLKDSIEQAGGEENYIQKVFHALRSKNIDFQESELIDIIRKELICLHNSIEVTNSLMFPSIGEYGPYGFLKNVHHSEIQTLFRQPRVKEHYFNVLINHCEHMIKCLEELKKVYEIASSIIKKYEHLIRDDISILSKEEDSLETFEKNARSWLN